MAANSSAAQVSGAEDLRAAAEGPYAEVGGAGTRLPLLGELAAGTAQPDRASAPGGVGAGLDSEPLEALQGYWEDLDTGFLIEVAGDEVDFHDGVGAWEAEEGPEGLAVRGAVLTGGLPDLAAWRLADGSEAVWGRVGPEVLANLPWSQQFLDYKVARTMLRRRLAAAVAAEDFGVAAALQEAWGGAWGCSKEASPEQELRLAAGRLLVPGVCVRHRRHGFRAAVLGCEPWVRAPLARCFPPPARGSPAPAAYRCQPIYCCLMDERDVHEGGAVFVPERDLEVSAEAFPIQSRFAGQLLEESGPLQGYLPGRALKAAMRRQQVGLPFVIGPP